MAHPLGVPPTVVSDQSNDLIYNMSYNGSDKIEYLGEAKVGSSGSDAVWKIWKYGYTGSNLTSVRLAGVGEHSSVWDDRASLEYA